MTHAAAPIKDFECFALGVASAHLLEISAGPKVLQYDGRTDSLNTPNYAYTTCLERYNFFKVTLCKTSEYSGNEYGVET